MADIELKVDGMSCSGCAASVTKAVQSIAPDATVSIDLPTGKVAVTGAPSRAAVEAAIIKAGYEVAA